MNIQGDLMKKTSSYTYFSICSNGEIKENGLISTQKGIFEPCEITNRLNIKPFKEWKKGDARIYNSNNEAPHSFYGFSSWNAEKSSFDRLDVTNQCLETISRLKEKIDELLVIKSLYDVSFSIMIVPSIYNKEQPYMSFNKEIIEFCYLTGTEIDIDLYIY